MTIYCVKEYVQSFANKKIVIACRKESILRSNIFHIIDDIQFLNEQKISISFFYTISSESENRKFIKLVNKKIPKNDFFRISSGYFYPSILEKKEIEFKLIFLEKDFIRYKNGKKINTFTTQNFYKKILPELDFKFHNSLINICQIIDSGFCERIHIIPAKKNSIKKELFSLEGSGTMIANNFTEKFRSMKTMKDVTIVNSILKMHSRSGFLKKRNKEYILSNQDNFYVTLIDNIIVGCVERKLIDNETIELAGLAVSARFLNQRVGFYTIKNCMENMIKEGFFKFIVLTKNPQLKKLLREMGFLEDNSSQWLDRRLQSPGVPLFNKIVD